MLGHGKHVEMLADRHKGLQQHLVVGVGIDAFHELPIDLQDVEIEIAQISEGREAGSEVVQREGDTPLLQPAHVGLPA